MIANLNEARRAKTLEALARCPACGAPRRGTLGPSSIGKITVYFECGATFSCEAGRPIGAPIACPGSSNVAAAALERQATGSV